MTRRRIDPSSGERRISVASAFSLRDEAWPAWETSDLDVQLGRVGDFDGDGLWDLLLLVRAAGGNEIHVTSGR